MFDFDDYDDSDILNNTPSQNEFSEEESPHYENVANGIEHFQSQDDYQNDLEHLSDSHMGGGFSTMPNIFGGQDVYNGGQRIGYSQPNIFGGQDFHACASASAPIFGVEDEIPNTNDLNSNTNDSKSSTDYQNDLEHLSDSHMGGGFSTMPNIFGGQDVYNGGQRIGYSQPNIFGGQDFHACASASAPIFGVENELPNDNNLDAQTIENPDVPTQVADVNYEQPLHMTEYIDLDGDGEPDQFIAYNIDENGLHLETAKFLNFDCGMYINDIDQFNTNDFDSENIIGHPEQSMEHWEYQGNTNRCALYAQKFVIEEVLDTEIDINDIVNIAKDNGLFTEEGGTSGTDVGKMFEYFNIPYESTVHGTFDDLINALQSGKKVIVSLDSDEIWHGEEDGIFSPWDQANHTVQVTGIAYNNAGDPMVILNDSGNPTSGCGAMIPADSFMDAWADSHNQMITV